MKMYLHSCNFGLRISPYNCDEYLGHVRHVMLSIKMKKRKM